MWLNLGNKPVRGTRKRKYTQSQIDEVLDLYRGGLSRIAIAAEVGTYVEEIHRLIKENMDSEEARAITVKNRIRGALAPKRDPRLTPTFEFRGGAAIAFCGKWST